MRTLAASFLIVSALGCRCSPTDPSAVTLRLKNTTSSSIFVDDTDDKLGLTVQRNVGGGWTGFEEKLKCACLSCDQVCSATCACDAGSPNFIRKVLPGDTFERAWNGIIQAESPSGCMATGCLRAENAPIDETFNLQLCYQSEILGVDLADGGRLAAVFPKPDQSCVDKEFRVIDGVVEVGPRKGTVCMSALDCVGIGELCLAGSCTASCPANGFPVLGAGWALRIDSSDQGFFASSTDGGTSLLSGTGEITSVIYNGGTMTVRLKRLGTANEVLTGAVFVTLPMNNAAPLPTGGMVTVQLFDGSTSTNPENRAVVIREKTGALLFAADQAQQGTLLKAAETAPFTVSFAAPLVGCRFNECGKQLFFKTRFSALPVESQLDPGKSALLTIPQGGYRALNVTSGTYGTTTCKLFDVRPFAIWREKAP